MAYRVFVSYAEQDRQFWKGLESYLSPLQRSELISAWNVENILPEQNKEQQILEQIQQAQIILLLISQHFIASDICYSVEMKEAIERHNKGEARVIPILLRPVLYKDTPIAALTTLPPNKAISDYPKRDKAYAEIAEGISAVIKDLAKTEPPPPTFPTSDTSPNHKAIRNFEDEKPVWLVPFERNDLFTGRSALLEQLYTRLHSVKGQIKAQVISGLGGMGKTQTALEYAYRYQDGYQSVFWVRAETNELLTGDFVGVAEAVGLPTKNIQDLNLIAASVKNWLRTHEDWLLILDNADDPERALEFVGRQLKGHVVLTSRNPGDGPGMQTLEIGEMKLDEGVDFLLLRANYTDNKDLSEEKMASAREIVSMMGGLPLALVQAGAYIASMRCGLAGYIDRYKTRRAIFLKDTRGLTAEHPEPVATTWLLSFESVEKANSAAADLLRLCAFFYPDEIPEEMIRAGKQGLSEPLQVIAEDDLLWDEAIYELIKYSLVRRQEGKSLTVHRLVQDVLREGMDEEKQKEWARVSIGMVDLAFQEENTFDEQNRKQYYVQHAQQCAIWIREMQLGSLEMVYFLLRVGRYLRERGQYNEAKPFLVQAGTVAEQECGEESAEIADILSNKAELYRLQGKYGEALPLAQKGLEIHEQAIQQPLKIADSSNTLARIYFNLARYTEAKALYERALAIREQELGENHPDVAESLNDLAVLYDSSLGDYKQTEMLHKRALAIRENVYGTTHPDTALSLDNLAGTYKDQGHYSLAKPLFKEALELRTRLLGPEHPDTLTSLSNLAKLHQDQGHYALAEPLLQQVHDLRTRLLGPEHPDTLSSLGNLGRLYRAQGRYSLAEPLYQQAHDLRTRLLGPEHPDTLTSLGNLASLYQDQDRYSLAEPLLQQVHDLRTHLLGPEHPNTLASLNNVALLYQSQKRYSLAEALFQQVRELSIRLLGPEHPNTLNCLSNLASLYNAQKRYPQAESLFKQVRSLRERILGPKHPDTATAIYNLACFYAEKRNYKQAEQLFPQALKTLEETLGPEHPKTITALTNYVALLWITSKARAAKMQKVLEERQRKAKEAQGASDEDEGK